ncbi:PDR/VanB family oxidoreductase [Gordonia otitidis]|uniref:PDR/VanB family oxidoreductase n=1 Tax=Gordonia otitidis TaxID=249058 RepID=UPI001D150662|nr:PDR/VanB family oxidoreductase [Gordonia otitidis]UEA59931.1 PDR/VanB family oxidoreductase [Gordonia otitidis]
MVSATVVDKRVVATDVIELILLPEGGKVSWQPGSHISVDLGSLGIRQYSLCGQVDAETLTIAVRNSGGEVSSALHHGVAVGDSLDVAAPVNAFELEEHADYVFIAGGIGITPLIPMIRHVDAAGAPWRLIYTNRGADRMAYRDLFVHDPRARLFTETRPVLSDVLEGSYEGTGVYACGPVGMLNELRLGFECFDFAGALRTESFEPASAAPSGDDADFVVRVGSGGRPLNVAPWESVLDVLERAGYELASSCRAGICGTCEVRVLAGLPDHRDDVLSDDEREVGAVLLPCVSRSLTDTLVIDIP